MNGAFSPGRTRMVEVTSAPKQEHVDADMPVLRLLNVGPALVFVTIGTGESVTTSVQTGMPISAGKETYIAKGVGADRLAAVSLVARPTRLYVTPGSGG